MKKGIHPKYETHTVTCVCGASYLMSSTKEIGKLEICAGCHPFFTGKQKYLDTAGRVDKFQQRYKKFLQPQPEPQPEA
jgi:large subunit ribosomal protein L31